MIKDAIYFDWKKLYIQLKIICEKSRDWPNANQEIIDDQIRRLDQSWVLIKEKYE